MHHAVCDGYCDADGHSGLGVCRHVQAGADGGWVALGWDALNSRQGGRGLEQGFFSVPVRSGPPEPRQRQGLTRWVPTGPQSAVGGRTMLRSGVPCSSPYSIGVPLSFEFTRVSDCFPKSVDLFLYLPAYLYATN